MALTTCKIEKQIAEALVAECMEANSRIRGLPWQASKLHCGSLGAGTQHWVLLLLSDFVLLYTHLS